MDAVYLIGRGSKIDNWELRMSLRSIEKYWAYGGPDKIWIVGEKPKFLKVEHPKIRFLAAKDPHKSSKDSNLIQKLLLFAAEPDAPSRFVFFSDDQGLLKECADSHFEPFHSGKIPQPHAADNQWLKNLKNTGKYLRDLGHSDLHFDTHVPQPMETEQLKRYLATPFGSQQLTVCSLYFNLCGERGVEIDATNIRAGLYHADISPSDIRKKTVELGNRFYSIDAGSVKNFWLVREMERLFPARADWELDDHVLSEDRKHFEADCGVRDFEVMRELLPVADSDRQETATQTPIIKRTDFSSSPKTWC